MPEAPVTVNGMPMIAVIHSSYDSFTGESDSEVTELYWRKRDGTRGKHVSLKVWDKIDAEIWGMCGILEQAFDVWAYERYVWDCALKGAPQVYQNGLEEGLTIDGFFQFE